MNIRCPEIAQNGGGRKKYSLCKALTQGEDTVTLSVWAERYFQLGKGMKL